MSSVDRQAGIQQWNGQFPNVSQQLRHSWCPDLPGLARVGPKVDWIRNWASFCSSGRGGHVGRGGGGGLALGVVGATIHTPPT